MAWVLWELELWEWVLLANTLLAWKGTLVVSHLTVGAFGVGDAGALAIGDL